MSEFKAHEEIKGIWSRMTTRHYDDRGFFTELFRLSKLESTPVNFKQQNLSYSTKMVRRGMHVQENQWQLVTLLSGTVVDILLDIRINSSTFGKFASYDLNSNSNEVNQLLVSPGIAHGFGVLSDEAYMLYSSDQSVELESAWPNNNWIESLRDRSFLKLSEAKNSGMLDSYSTKI